MIWVGRDLRDHPVQPPAEDKVVPQQLRLPRAHPAWPWAPPGMGQPQLSGQQCQSLTALEMVLTHPLEYLPFG